MRPAEAHAHVAGDVDDQASRSEGGQIVLGDEDQGRAGILENAVDDDVVVREEAGHRDGAVRVSAHIPSGRLGSCPSG